MKNERQVLQNLRIHFLLSWMWCKPTHMDIEVDNRTVTFNPSINKMEHLDLTLGLHIHGDPYPYSS